MSKVICSTCGTVLSSEYKFCVSCGKDPRNVHTSAEEPIAQKRDTFFCPKCSHENPIDEIICLNCREDFGKYKIRRSIAETSRSQMKVLVDKTDSFALPIKRSDLRVFMYVIALLVVIGAGVFIWWIIRYISGEA